MNPVSFLLVLACVVGCSPPTPPAPRRPHSIVLITVDTLRADHLNATTTPALHRLAGESIQFDQAVSVGPLTLPAHASILTGLYPPRHGVRDNHVHSLAPEVPTLTERLKAAGYATGAFVSAIVLDERYGLARAFDVYDDEVGPIERRADETLARASRWMESASSPFFLWVHLFEPHAPYLAGSYAREVSTTDQALGRFLDALRSSARWPETVVSVTADHGESLGEHGEKTHGFFVYDSTLRVPWIIRVPGRKGERVADQVRLVDVVPTLAALARAPIPSMEGIDGVDLAPFIDEHRPPALEAYGETWLPRHQFGWSELRSLRTSRGKFIAAPTPEVYDLTRDPGERQNLASTRGDLVSSMGRQLAAVERAAVTRTRATASDPVLAERFMSLGYIGYSPPSSVTPTAAGADPKDKIDVYQLTMDALEASEERRHEEALSMLARAERLDAQVAQVPFLEGVIFGNIGRFAEAAAALERAVALSPRHVVARFKLALAYIRTGRTRDAERVLAAVLRDEPQNFRALHNLAAIAYTRGDLDRAESLERRAVALDGDYAEAWNTLGAIYLVRRDLPAAKEALERATRLDPADAQAWRNLSLALRAANETAAAQSAMNRACTIDPRLCRAGR